MIDVYASVLSNNMNFNSKQYIYYFFFRFTLLFLLFFILNVYSVDDRWNISGGSAASRFGLRLSK